MKKVLTILSLSTLLITSLIAMDKPPQRTLDAIHPSARKMHEMPSAAVGSKNLPQFLQYQKLSSVDQLNFTLNTAIDVLGEQILRPHGISTMDLVGAQYNPDFDIAKFVPADKEEDEQGALLALSQHYLYLLNCRTVFQTVLMSNFPVTSVKLTLHNLKESSIGKKYEASAYQPASKIDEKLDPKVVLIEFSDEQNDRFYFYMDPKDLKDEHPHKHPLGNSRVTFQDLKTALMYLRTFRSGLQSHGDIRGFYADVNPGKEVRGALDTILGTEFIDNPHNTSMYSMSPMNDHYARRELNEATYLVAEYKKLLDKTDLLPEFKGKLTLDKLTHEAKQHAWSLQLQDPSLDATAPSPVYQATLSQAKKRDKVLSMLAEVPTLFTAAFHETNDARIAHIKKKFSLEEPDSQNKSESNLLVPATLSLN